MALKAVHFHCSIVMTFAAKMFRILDGYRLVIRTLDHVAGKALFQAMLPGANTLVHGFVSLMQQDFHMVFAHEVGIFHALVTFYGIRDGGFGHICHHRVAGKSNQQE